MGTITILIAAIVITAGTSAPLLTKFMASQSQVGPSFYNKVNLPIAMLIACLLAFVPYLTWKGTPGRELLRKLALPIAFGVAIAVAAAVWRVRDGFHLVFILLAATALATNLQKTIDKYRSGGLKALGGYLTHVGVGIILLGIIASSGYDQSSKVTLTQGVPRQIDGGMTLTFKRHIPPQGREKERMEVEVTRAGQKPFLVYPKMFMNSRTRQMMVNPDIKSSPFQDLYVSPIEFDPGVPRLQLTKGQSAQMGDVEVRFVQFDLNRDGNALVAMREGRTVTIGAQLAITQGGRTVNVTPVYRLNPANGAVESPPTSLPGGGTILVSGINASNGAVQLETNGLAKKAMLSIDVTRKPLIQLVWGGLYVVLFGGILTLIQRFRQAAILNRLE
jgi:cytochrome c-type biogenesis protein CcmF